MNIYFLSDSAVNMSIKRVAACVGQLPKVRGAKAARFCCYFLCALAVIEFIFLNLFMLYVVGHFSQTFTALTSREGSQSFLNRLQENGFVNDIIGNAKSNQIFQRTLQETLERVFIVHSKQKRSRQGKPLLTDARDRSMRDISFFGLDVSHSREATYIYQRILSRKEFPYQFFIVDIGANDGFLSSNSFNFIQWGWDAVLVDPQGQELQTAWKNIKR